MESDPAHRADYERNYAAFEASPLPAVPRLVLRTGPAGWCHHNLAGRCDLSGFAGDEGVVDEVLEKEKQID